MSAIAVRGTLDEMGPFAVGDKNQSLLLLQIFSGIVTITMLVLAAAVRSRVIVEEELRNREHQLRLALSARAESEARAAVVLDAAVDGILTIDERGTIETVNRATQRLFGYQPEEIIGRNIKMLMPPPFSDEHDTYLKNYLTTGNKKIIGIGREVSGLRKDGTTFPMDLSVSEVRIAAGRRIFTGIVHDITEHKRAQNEREQLLESERQARSEAERTSRMKDEFLATLSHEMRTPLNAILGYASLLRHSQIDPKETAEGLEVIDRNARMQARLIEDLLDMSRIISGKVRLDVHLVELANVIDSAIETVRPAAEAKRINLTKNLEPVAPISGDAARLQQVLWNLLTNAIKFTPSNGKVDVRLQKRDTHVEITISDTGQGISPEFMPHMFERFRQADASTTRKHGGLGLGLAIVKHLVEMHGGSISARSDGEGKGSTFIISLPQSLHSMAELPSSTRPETSSETTRPKLPNLRGTKILIVDDDADARELMERIFKECHATVLTAASVDQALFQLAQEVPDILISDIGMPTQDGYDLIRAVRHLKSERIANLPAIALTAFARSEDRTKALLAGYDAHLAKPTDPLDLATTVSTLLKRSPVA